MRELLYICDGRRTFRRILAVFPVLFFFPRLRISFRVRHWQLFASIASAVCLGITSQAAAEPMPQTARYWVQLRDKGGVRFDPATYFSPQAQARRRRQHLPAADSSDFPVRPDYVSRVQAGVDSVVFVSRWFNAISCWATPMQATRLRHLPGVRAVTRRPDASLLPAALTSLSALGNEAISAEDRQLARRQTASLGAADFQTATLDGRGLRIAIFDVGFNGADHHPAFQHLVRDKRIVATYDFVKRRNSVFAGGTHGTEVLSCIAGLLPDGTPLGLAPKAEFLLARTERLHREIYAEEEAWLAAAEWADRNGADIINSSLGYTNRRYFPEQMNGYTSLVARAAELAVRKGILVVNAAGNDGDNEDWHTVGTPADGDSVLAVGGLDPDTFLHVDFSSYGPSADRQVKPNVTAFGTVLAAAPGGYVRTQGTSFASPLVVGFAACAWQQNRQLTVMQLFAKIQESADLYPYFDYAHGYGLPRASALLQERKPRTEAAFDLVREDSLLSVIIRPSAAYVSARTLPLYADSVVRVTSLAPKTPSVPRVGREELKPPLSGEPKQGEAAGEAAPQPPTHPDYLYWHIADRYGVLRTYEVLEVTQRAVLRLPLSRLRAGDTVRVHYRGFTQSYSVQ
ncbi:hypothetical protein FHG12_19405 [Hymenobacter jejuensis]|uniref:Peptidase S8/S53 domain-containing protein n=1 Tax=Hymenobacter jejuensis TaxID=2502781 RepID=A0A5B8A600_9BACT|nr:hypothetical protein FHG12_19405 [Hymenobacter jejuensis]